MGRLTMRVMLLMSLALWHGGVAQRCSLPSTDDIDRLIEQTYDSATVELSAIQPDEEYVCRSISDETVTIAVRYACTGSSCESGTVEALIDMRCTDMNSHTWTSYGRQAVDIDRISPRHGCDMCLNAAERMATYPDANKATYYEDNHCLVFHKCYNETNCMGTVILENNIITKRECCLSEEEGLSYSTPDGCSLCIVHGFAKERYNVTEGMMSEISFECNVKGRTSFPLFSLFGTITANVTDIEPIRETVQRDGITFNVVAINDDIALEDSDHFILKYVHDFGPEFVDIVEQVGEYIRDTAFVEIIDNDDLKLSFSKPEHAIKEDHSIAEPIAVNIGKTQRPFNLKLRGQASTGIDDDLIATPGQDFTTATVTIEIPANEEEGLYNITLDEIIIDDQTVDVNKVQTFVLHAEVTEDKVCFMEPGSTDCNGKQEITTNINIIDNEDTATVLLSEEFYIFIEGDSDSDVCITVTNEMDDDPCPVEFPIQITLKFTEITDGYVLHSGDQIMSTTVPFDSCQNETCVNAREVLGLRVEDGREYLNRMYNYSLVSSSLVLGSDRYNRVIADYDAIGTFVILDNDAVNLTQKNTLTEYTVVEGQGPVIVCLVVDNAVSKRCPIDFAFYFNLVTAPTGTAEPYLDYGPLGEEPGTGVFKFDRCTHEKCVEIDIKEDNVMEPGGENFTFTISLRLSNGDDSVYIYDDQQGGTVHIMDPETSQTTQPPTSNPPPSPTSPPGTSHTTQPPTSHPLPSPTSPPVATCQTGDVRLVGGDDTAGRVEICYGGMWGTVCDDAWGTNDAIVVCRQLGIPSSSPIAIPFARFGAGQGPIFLDDVQCDGTESSLLQCHHSGISIHNCLHIEDAGVSCLNGTSQTTQPPTSNPPSLPTTPPVVICQTGDVRLVGGIDTAGRVEICYGGTWGTVCDDSWDTNDAIVVCRQLEMPYSSPIAIPLARFGVGQGPIFLDDVQCDGTESSLLQCHHNGISTHNCLHSEDAGVSCLNETSQTTQPPTSHPPHSPTSPPDGEGAEYFVAFSSNFVNTNSLQIFVTTRELEPVPFSVETLRDFHFSGIVSNTATVSFQLPSSFKVTSSSERDKGIRFSAGDKQISVYGLSYGVRTSAVFSALSCSTQNITEYEYYGITRGSVNGSSSQFLFVACEDNTTIQVDSELLTLNEMETYLYTDERDLTGMRVVSDKPISFFSGHQCNNIPAGVHACDHILEQLPNTALWGKHFLSASLYGRNTTDIYTVVSSTPSTTVTFSCSNETDALFYTISQFANNHETVVVPNNYFCAMHSNNPVLVVQYAQGQDADDVESDPLMMTVSSIEHYSNYYTIIAPSEFPTSVIAIYVPTEYYQPEIIFVNQMSQINTYWTSIPCVDQTTCGYAAYVTVESGDHSVYHKNTSAIIGVQVYGFKYHNGYGYSAVGAIPLSFRQGITCSYLHMPANGNVLMSGNSPGDIANYSCHPGYQMNGDAVLNCQSDGTWDNSPPTCQNITDGGGANVWEYFVAFSKNYVNTNSLQLVVSTRELEPVPFTIETLRDIQFSGIVTNLATVSLQLPNSFEVTSSTKSDKGIRISAGDKQISVYGVNYRMFSSSIFSALSCSRQAVSEYEYYGITLGGVNGLPSQFLFVACEDNTTIQVDSELLTLNEMETYLYTDGRDLTGMRVVSDKPISFFSGHQCNNIPAGVGACDHILEQLPNTALWGTHFLSASLYGRNTTDIYTVVSSTPSTTVTFACSNQITLTISQFANNHENVIVPDDSICKIDSNNPVLVVQYAQGGNADGVDSDPFMMTVSSIEHYCDYYAIIAPSEFPTSIITILVPPEFYQPERIFVNDQSGVNAHWTSIPCSDQTTCGYVANIIVGSGDHSVYHDNTNAMIGVQVYGFTSYNGYGYSAVEPLLSPFKQGITPPSPSTTTPQASPTSTPVTICQTGDVRLVGGNDTAGRVEICYGRMWGTVCDDSWGTNDAIVVCRQLGIPSSSPIAIHSARFGVGQGPIFLDDVQCDGTESSLLQCHHRGISTHNCLHSEDAGVSCLNVFHKCYNKMNCIGAVIQENITKGECCLSEEEGLSYSTPDGCSLCIVHGFEKGKYNVSEGMMREITFERNVKGRTSFPLLSLVGTITANVTDIQPTRENVRTGGITFNVVAINDNIALEDGDHFILKYVHRSGREFVDIVEQVGEYIRDTAFVEIIDNDDLKLSFTKPEYDIKEDHSMAEPIAVNIGKTQRPFKLKLRGQTSTGIDGDLIATPDKDFKTATVTVEIPANKEEAQYSITLDNIIIDDVTVDVNKTQTFVLHAEVTEDKVCFMEPGSTDCNGKTAITTNINIIDNEDTATVLLSEEFYMFIEGDPDSDICVTVTNEIDDDSCPVEFPIQITLNFTEMTDGHVLHSGDQIMSTTLPFDSCQNETCVNAREVLGLSVDDGRVYLNRMYNYSFVSSSLVLGSDRYDHVVADYDAIGTFVILDNDAVNLTQKNTLTEYTVVEGQGPVIVCLVVDNAVSKLCPIDFAFYFNLVTAPTGTAEPYLDYGPLGEYHALAVFKFDRCTREKCAEIDIKEDNVMEPGGENFTFTISLRLSNGDDSVYIDDDQRSGTVHIMDPVTYTVSMEEATMRVSEDVGMVEVCAILTSSSPFPLPTPVTVGLRTVDGTAVSIEKSNGAPVDYVHKDVQLEFMDSSTQCAIISIIDDKTVEYDEGPRREKFTVELITKTDVSIVGTAITEIFIRDNDIVLVRLEHPLYNVYEDEGNLEVCAEIRPDFNETCPIQFDQVLAIATEGDEAESPRDYRAFAEMVPISACGRRVCVNVTINDDNIVENNETFLVLLERIPDLLTNGVELNRTTARVTIIETGDEMVEVSLIQKTYTVNEKDRLVNVCIQVTGENYTFPFQVLFSTTDGTAKSPTHYISATQNVTFQAFKINTEKCIEIEIKNVEDHSTVDDIGSFTVNVAGHTGLNSRIKFTQITESQVTITDSDIAVVGLDDLPRTVREGNQVVACFSVFSPPQNLCNVTFVFNVTLYYSYSGNEHFEVLTYDPESCNNAERIRDAQCHTILIEDNIIENDYLIVYLSVTEHLPPNIELEERKYIITIEGDDEPSQSLELLEIKPVNSRAVTVSWRGNGQSSTTVRYECIFNETGSIVTLTEFTLRPSFTSTIISVCVEDTVPEYRHRVTLTQDMQDGGNQVTRTFDLDQKYFQIQFGPVEYCINWGYKMSGHTEDQLKSHIARIIRDRCDNCTEFSERFLRRGMFLCHNNPTTATYRSALVSPFSTDSRNSSYLLSILQNWISTAPSLTLDRLLVRVNRNCPTGVTRLDVAECTGESSFLPNSAITQSIHTVLNQCVVEQLGAEMCSV